MTPDTANASDGSRAPSAGSALALSLLIVGAASACSLFDPALACDEATACPDGLVCELSGFCSAAVPSDGGDARRATSTVLTLSDDTLELGGSVTLTATVTTTDGVPVAEGGVRFERSTDLSTFVALSTVAIDEAGTATLLDAPPVSGRVVRARFEGTERFSPSTSAVSAPITVFERVSVTQAFEATWSRTFFGSGNPREDPEFMFFCIQGQFSATNGNQKCAVGFDDAEISAFVDGDVVVDVEAFLAWDHFATGPSGVAVVGTHGSSDAPATFQDLDDLVAGRLEVPFDVDEAKWFSLGGDVADAFLDGTVRGIVLGPAPNTDQSFYGYALGATLETPPALRVTVERVVEVLDGAR